MTEYVTEYVMARDLADAKRKFELCYGALSIRRAVHEMEGSKLFKRVKTPGKLVWYNNTEGPIPEGVEVRWDAVMRATAIPPHLSILSTDHRYLHKTPDTLTCPIRYPVIGRPAQDTFKVTELK